jgi:hypothetical protein
MECHKKTPCVQTKKNVILFFTKTENRRAEQILSVGLVPMGGRRMWRKGVGGKMWCKHCAYMYVNKKCDLLKLFQEWRKME